jgi:hypothetical protein
MKIILFLCLLIVLSQNMHLKNSQENHKDWGDWWNSWVPSGKYQCWVNNDIVNGGYFVKVLITRNMIEYQSGTTKTTVGGKV